jgi:hypothetical protein
VLALHLLWPAHPVGQFLSAAQLVEFRLPCHEDKR